MSVTLTVPAVRALDRGLDQTRIGAAGDMDVKIVTRVILPA